MRFLGAKLLVCKAMRKQERNTMTCTVELSTLHTERYLKYVMFYPRTSSLLTMSAAHAAIVIRNSY